MYHRWTEWKAKIADNISAADGKYTFDLKIIIIIIIIIDNNIIIIIIKTFIGYIKQEQKSLERVEKA